MSQGELTIFEVCAEEIEFVLGTDGAKELSDVVATFQD